MDYGGAITIPLMAPPFVLEIRRTCLTVCTGVWPDSQAIFPKSFECSNFYNQLSF